MMRYLARRLSDINSPILLTGETGTGKSFMARKIHQESKNRNAPFVTANLAAVCESLFESELFGHVRGAYTGAQVARKGLCELAGKGTLFLDEIGELPLQLQKKLLFMLEERRYCCVGSSEEKIFCGRIIAATNKNVEDMLENGEFRRDLYYRLRVFCHEMTPLRENRSDLRLYIEKFFSEKDISCSEKIRNKLLGYHWPGNIRELRHAVEYYSIMGVLPPWMNFKCSKIIGSSSPYAIAKEEFEKAYLSEAIYQNRGAINQTARNIRISKSTLIAKLRKYDIEYRSRRVS